MVFTAGPNVGEADPMGEGGDWLHEWMWMAGNGPDGGVDIGFRGKFFERSSCGWQSRLRSGQLASRPTRPPDCDRRHRDRASISALKLTGQGILLAPRWSLALERFL